LEVGVGEWGVKGGRKRDRLSYFDELQRCAKFLTGKAGLQTQSATDAHSIPIGQIALAAEFLLDRKDRESYIVRHGYRKTAFPSAVAILPQQAFHLSVGCVKWRCHFCTRPRTTAGE
jgi:hypothetical protein